MSVAELVPGFVRSGKVRDIFSLDDARLLLVASDRISAFDVVLPTAIPDKGRVLTGISRFWFAETSAAGIMPNHLLSVDVTSLPSGSATSRRIAARDASTSSCIRPPAKPSAGR